MPRVCLKTVCLWALIVCSVRIIAQEADSDDDQSQLHKLRNLVHLGTTQTTPDRRGLVFSSFSDLEDTAPFVEGGKPLVIAVTDLPAGVVAKYRYALDTGFHSVPSTGIPFPSERAMVLIRLKKSDDKNLSTACPASERASDYTDSCERDVVYSRDLLPTAGPNLLPAFVISADGLEVSALLPGFSSDLAHANYIVNGTSVAKMRTDTIEPILVGASSKHFLIQRYAASDACSLYQDPAFEYFDFDRPRSQPSNLVVDNGISVAPSKAYDNSTLRQMLAGTSAQLAGISGFNQSVLMGALGNIQGVTRDTSYLSAQVTTIAPPSVTSTAVTGGTTSNTLANTLGVNNGSTISNSTITCPPGTLPGIGTSGLPACAAVVAGTATVGSTGAGNINGGSSPSTSQQSTTSNTLATGTNQGQTSNQQNTIATTNTGQAGVVAAAPVSTAFAAPTNLGVSASDLLAEQVQLNSEITTLRLLLQGALSTSISTTRAEPSAHANRLQLALKFI